MVSLAAWNSLNSAFHSDIAAGSSWNDEESKTKSARNSSFAENRVHIV